MASSAKLAKYDIFAHFQAIAGTEDKQGRPARFCILCKKRFAGLTSTRAFAHIAG